MAHCPWPARPAASRKSSRITIRRGIAGFGFLCFEKTPDAFWDSIKRAREVFHDKTIWTELMERAMARDFSWSEAAERYENVYSELVTVGQRRDVA